MMRRPTGDAGNAMVEFCFLAVLVMVPIMYVLLAVFAVQNASYAVSSASREAARAYVTSASLDDADDRARVAAAIAAGDHGLRLPSEAVTIACDDDCLAPGSVIRTTVRYRVGLPFVPSFLGGSTSIRVRATHVELVDPYRSAGSS